MIKKFLNLGPQPLANKYLSRSQIKKNFNEYFYNLKVGFNTKTKLVSILHTISSKKMFDNKYPYRSSMSKTMMNSSKKLSEKIKKKYNPNFLLEIGSNDGGFIKNFSKRNVVCVEPCKNLATVTKKMGYLTYSEFWDIKLAKKIKKKKKEFDLIYSANTLSHIKNLNSVFKSINHLLSEEGILIIEDPSLLECFKKISYDQFYNEHIYVFSLLSIIKTIKKFNLEVFDVEKLTTHGGSLRYYIKKFSNKKFSISKKVKEQLNQEKQFGLNRYSTYRIFNNKVENSRKKLNKIFLNLKKENKKIIGYGATAKVTTVLNYCNIKNTTIDYFVDTTPDKVGKYMPGSHIYIKKYRKPLTKDIDYAFLGAWNFKDEILKKEKKYIKNGGKFITHIPFPKII